MARNSINSHDSNENKITLKDLANNSKEKLANLSDEELQQLKQQAIEIEDYDIAKMIKQEQSDRIERNNEDENSELEEDNLQLKREESRKEVNEKIQAEKVQTKEEDMIKAGDLMDQLNDSKEWTENAESLKEQKIKMLNDMYSSIANAHWREILKFERSGAAKDRWYEHNEAYATAAFQMIIAYETFVKDNEDQLKNLWLEKDINKLYNISQSIRHRYATWEWIMKEAEMQQAFDWIRKYVENLENNKDTRSEFKNSFVDEDLYKEYIIKHGGTSVRNEKII